MHRDNKTQNLKNPPGWVKKTRVFLTLRQHQNHVATAPDGDVSHYTQSRSTMNRVYDSKARRYAEDNRTESNCTHW